MIKYLFLDFDGVLTDNFMYINERGEESVRCYRGDGMGLEKLKAAGVEVYIISSECNDVVPARARKLKVDCIFNVKDKREAIQDICQNLENAAFMGNDVNDYEAMEACGIAIAPLDARPEVREIADYITKTRGGHGAVREACGWLMAKMK